MSTVDAANAGPWGVPRDSGLISCDCERAAGLSGTTTRFARSSGRNASCLQPCGRAAELATHAQQGLNWADTALERPDHAINTPCKHVRPIWDRLHDRPRVPLLAAAAALP